MAFELLMPKMGESVQEATITKWFIKEGDTVEEEDVLLEIATDKVDSEIPSPVDGTVKKVLYEENDKIAVGEVIALIATDDDDDDEDDATEQQSETTEKKEDSPAQVSEQNAQATETQDFSQSDRFYSPLVKSIAQKEGISLQELDSLAGSGQNGRVRKQDILAYLDDRKSGKQAATKQEATKETASAQAGSPAPAPAQEYAVKPSVHADDEIREMDRIRKMIAQRMVASKHVSPHVTTMVEADVTNLVVWRNKVKKAFEEKEGEKITFMPLFIEAVAKALRDYPDVNVAVDGDKIIMRKHINVGVAVALPNNNLIVPVIKDADHKNLLGLTKEMNRLAVAARNNKLKQEEIEGGTFSISNFGSFQNVMGTPIINQPEVAILAVGSIEKKPAVIETPTGDIIGIRHKMFLSLSYDHRVVDGALGGAFLRRIADYLEGFDVNREII